MVDLAREDLEPQLSANNDESIKQDVMRFLGQSAKPPEIADTDDFIPQERSIGGTALAVGKDIALGAAELPRAIVKGTRNAIQETLDLTDDLADFLETKIPLGRPVLFQDGEFKPGVVEAKPEETGVELPEILEDPESVTGNFAKSVTQFLVGFAGAGKIPGIRALKGVPITQAAIKGAVADFTVFDGHEGRLSNLIQSFPQLQNPVTEFLQAQPGDSEIEGRLKNAVEGLGLGVATDGFIKALRLMRSARKARSDLAGSVTQVDETARFSTPDDAFTQVLGDAADTSEDFVTKIRRTEDVADIGSVNVEEVRRGFQASPPFSIDDIRQRNITSLSAEDLKLIDDAFANTEFDKLPIEAIHNAAVPATGHIKVFRGAIGSDPLVSRRQLFSTSPNQDVAEIFGRLGVSPSQGDGVIAEIDIAPGVKVFVPDSGVDGGEIVISGRGTDFIKTSSKTETLPNGAKIKRIKVLAVPSDQFPRTTAGVPDDIAAKGLTKTADVGGEEVFVNFARIDTSDDVKKVIGLMADSFKDDIEKARRGVRTNVETIASAQDIDAFKELQNRPTATPLNAEKTLAVRELWTATGRKLQETAEAAATNPSNENLFAFRKMLATFHAVQSEVISVRTETARALQAWRIPAGEGTERFAQIDSVMQQFGGSQLNRDFAERIAILGREGGLNAVANGVDKGVVARTADAVREYWINALLSGPKTHLVNTMSNASVIGQVITERAIAARIGRVLGDEGVEVGEAIAAMHGVRMSMRDAFKHGAKVFRDEFRFPDSTREPVRRFGRNKIDLPREPSISATKFGLRTNTYTGRAVDSIGNMVRAPGAALAAEDEFFKTIGYRMELNALAFRQATREARNGIIDQKKIKERMLEIIQDPPENINIAAIDAAAYQTFTAKGSSVAQSLQRVMGKLPVLRYFTPFVNTPDNILRYSFERTPLAPAMKQFRDAVAAGGARQQMALARLSLGTTATMIALDMSFNGLLTGNGPPDRGERTTLNRAGWQRYSVKIGDRFFAYNRLDPVGFTLGLSADIAEYIENAQMDSSSGFEIGEVLAALGASIAGNITNKTYFTGITELVEAMDQPEQRAEGWIKRFAGSFIPVAVKEVERLIDPNLRATSNIVEELRANTPGMSTELPQRVDVWGRPISYRSGIKPDELGFVYDMVSPIYSKKFNPEPIDREMLDEGFFVSMPSKRLTIGRTTFNLRNSPDIYNRYIELRGNALKLPGNGNLGAKDFLNQVVTGQHRLSQAYSNLTDAQAKEDFVKKVLRAYGDLAKRQILQEFPQLQDQIEISGGKKRDVILP